MNKLHHFSRLAEWRKDMTASPAQTTPASNCRDT